MTPVQPGAWRRALGSWQWPGLANFLAQVDPSLRNRMMGGALWSLAGAGLASAFIMVTNIVCARFLGAVHYGELAIVLATINLFTTLFASGLGMTATRYVAEHRTSNPKRAGSIVGLSWVTSIIVGAVTALFIVLLSPWLSRVVLGDNNLVSAVNLGAAVMFFAALTGAQVGILSGFEAFNRIALGNFFRGAGIIICVSVGAALDGVKGALYGYIAVGLVTVVYYQIAVQRECASNAIASSYHFDKQDFQILWRFTLPVLITAFSFTPAAWWSNILLATKSGYAEAGVFNATLHWQSFILFIPSAVSNIGLPMLSNLRAERDSRKYRRCLGLCFLLNALPAIVIAIPVAIASRIILRLYGPAFVHGATALVLISIFAVLYAVNGPVGHALWSLDATVPAVLLALLRGGVLVVFSYLLAGYGATGIAAAYVIMGVVQTATTIPFTFWLLRRKLVPAPTPQVALI